MGLLLLVMAGLLAGTSGRRPDRRGWRPGARPSLRSPADPPGQASSPHLTSGSDTTGLWLRSDWADVLRGLLGQDDVSFDAGNGLDLQYSAYVRACVTNCSNQGTCNIFTGR